LLAFQNDSKVVLDRKNVSNSEMENYFWPWNYGAQIVRGPQSNEFQRTLGSEKIDSSGSGYTQMWEEELGRRFSTTNFMPLEPGQQLSDGRIKVVRQLAFGGSLQFILLNINLRYGCRKRGSPASQCRRRVY